MKIEKLIERIKAGDADALRTVYETYSQRMRNVCIRITREDEATVSDLVQESFIRAYYSLGKLKDASKFGEWIVAITKNVSLRYLERKQNVQVMPFSSIADGFDVESSLASDSMLEDKALMEIVINNMNNANNIKNGGKIVEHEHHDKPITFGLSVSKSLGNKWNLETGLQYSLLKSNFTLGEDSYYIKQNQKVHYLGIPLQVSYRWFDVKNWSAYSSLGATLHIPIYGKNTKQYVTGKTIPYMNSSHFIPSFQWAIGTGIGLQYQFMTNWYVYFEPTFSWYIPNGSTTHTIWTEQPFTITVPFGIRFTW